MFCTRNLELASNTGFMDVLLFVIVCLASFFSCCADCLEMLWQPYMKDRVHWL